MATALSDCRIELSKQQGDFWAGTTTSAGDSTSLIDIELKQFADDWITDWTWDFITKVGHTAVNEERRVSSLDNSSGDCTLVAAHGASVGSDTTYELHRLFSPTEKSRALVYAARASFPHLHEKIWDESFVSGNWLKDGSFEIWTDSSDLTYWTDDGTVILDQTSTSPYYKHGTYSCKLLTAAGVLKQSITDWDDLKHLAGKACTFTTQGFCSTASTLRIAIYDGTTTTYSDYRTAESAWTRHNDPMSVTATIQDNPTAIEFQIMLDTANPAYVDDARVIVSGTNPRLYIADLGLAQEQPHEIYIEQGDYSSIEPWLLINSTELDTENGYLYLPSWVSSGYRLRIKGIGSLDFLLAGVSSTSWSASVNINAPQTDILYAAAMVYLCLQKILPNDSQGMSDRWKEALGFWQGELRQRKAKHSMPALNVPVKWR